MILTLAVLNTACTRAADSPSAPGQRVDLDGPYFEDITEASGLDFEHVNGMEGDRHLVEIMGSGAALLDYDQDGDLDAFLVQGGALRSDDSDRPAATESGDQLFRNELISEDGRSSESVRFARVTEASGLHSNGYGMAAAVGDYNDDGWPDIYVANWGADQLWRNNGDGTFRDVSVEAGVATPGWSSAATFFDYDRDGLLDLFVVGYLDYDIDNPVPCYAQSTGGVDYCSPAVFPASPDRLYRNLGDGRFSDVTTELGIVTRPGHGLGVATADFNGDGWTEIYVANDGDENHLWHNLQGTGFENVGALSGSAVNMAGGAEASMGVGIDDFDADGDPDIFLTHLANETNTLYLNDGDGFFKDATRAFGIAQASHEKTAFGIASLDLQNDGFLDLLIADGAVTIIYDQETAGDPLPLRQTNQVLLNDAGEGFLDVSSEAGPTFDEADVYRGVAVGDLDNDGDSDALITRNNGAAVVLENRIGQDASWIGFQAKTSRGAYDSSGVGLVLDNGDSRPLHRWTRADSSYASSRDPRVIFGLAEDSGPQAVEVVWPDGSVERWSGLPAGRYHLLIRGEGESVVDSGEGQ